MSNTTKFVIAAAAASLLSATSAEAQKARSMYGTPGADAPATTQTAALPIEGMWVGTVNRKEGGTRPLSFQVRSIGGGYAEVIRDGNDRGRVPVSRNSLTMGTNNKMTLTVNGSTGTVTGLYDNGVAVKGSVRRQ